MQGGHQFMLKFSFEFIVRVDHYTTFLDLHLHRGWKNANEDAYLGPLGLPLEVSKVSHVLIADMILFWQHKWFFSSEDLFTSWHCAHRIGIPWDCSFVFQCAIGRTVSLSILMASVMCVYNLVCKLRGRCYWAYWWQVPFVFTLVNL